MKQILQKISAVRMMAFGAVKALVLAVKNFRIGQKKAFTLMELLIAMSIFVIFLTLAGSSYISIIRAQKSANEVRQMYSDLRGFIDEVNETMRSGRIDYSCYSDVRSSSNPNIDISCDSGAQISAKNRLIIASNDGLKKTHFIYESESNTLKEKIYARQSLSESWISSEKPLNFQNLQIKNLQWDIAPKQDPNVNFADLSTQLQPMVWVNLSVTSKIPTVQFDLDFQTLITSRFSQS